MGGELIALGPCFRCARPFTFNPYTVPSMPIDPLTGLPPDLCTCGEPAQCTARAVRRPICADCRRIANESRRAAGLTLWPVEDERS